MIRRPDASKGLGNALGKQFVGHLTGLAALACAIAIAGEARAQPDATALGFVRELQGIERRIGQSLREGDADALRRERAALSDLLGRTSGVDTVQCLFAAQSLYNMTLVLDQPQKSAVESGQREARAFQRMMQECEARAGVSQPRAVTD